MKEVIEGILQAEKEARDVVQASRDKAKVLRIDAEKEAQTLIAQAREGGREKVESLLVQAEKDAEAEKNKALEQAASETGKMEDDAEAMQETVNTLFNMIVGKS